VRSVFADTFYWVALYNRRDAWHRRAKAMTVRLRGALIVTTEEVLVEFLAAFCDKGPHLRSQAHGAVRGLLTNEAVQVLPQTHASFAAGLELYGSRPDKGYSLTDCISMTVMRERGITEVLSHDHHFSQEGFTLLFTE
jgi:predicted nucleic acid-binding protein